TPHTPTPNPQPPTPNPQPPTPNPHRKTFSADPNYSWLVTHAGVGFHASTQPTFILYLIPPTHLI
ncbi:MAG: hypothetical protein EWV84_18585, partial [Microcystis sp. M_QC_C_20170808_M3Col]